MQMDNASHRIILFGRYPVPGCTKTRLIPVLGPIGAAEVQRQWTEMLLGLLLRAGPAAVTFAYSGGTRRQVRHWLGDKRLQLQAQPAGDLGLRMQRVIEDAFRQGAQRVILLGTDVPDLTPAHIGEAFHALDTHDVVLGPSADGGYWLVGCRRPLPLFKGILWGTPRVLAQTMDAAASCGLSTALLPQLRDIDDEGDLRRWCPEREWPRPYLSVVIPTLNEADRIAQTIGALRSPDVETIVADGGSWDGTPELSRQEGALVIATPRGRALQQNLGARRARGRVVLFLHADTVLPCNFGNQIFDALLDRRVVLGAFRFKTDLDVRAMRWIEWAAQIRSRVLQLPYGDQAFFMRKSIFESVGGFPEAPIAEDLLLARRLGRLGRVAIAPGTAVTSGRRWRALGIGRTTLINSVIAGGCMMGIDPRHLAPFYTIVLSSEMKRTGIGIRSDLHEQP